MLNFKDSFAHTNGSVFPNTAAKNSSGGGATDGTHFNANFIDDFWGFAQAALSQAGITPSGANESASASQILDGIVARALSDAGSDDIDNESTVGGDSVSDALESNASAVAGKEDAFSKNSAFNKDFGTTVGTVADGGDVTTALAGKAEDVHTHVYSSITNLIDDSGPLTYSVQLADTNGVNSNTVTVGVRFKRVAGYFTRVVITPSSEGDRLDWDVVKPTATDLVYANFTLTSGTIPSWVLSPNGISIPCALSFQSSQGTYRSANTRLLISADGGIAIILMENSPSHPILLDLFTTSVMY